MKEIKACLKKLYGGEKFESYLLIWVKKKKMEDGNVGVHQWKLLEPLKSISVSDTIKDW